MADQAKVESVKLNLPAWRIDLAEWNDTKIEQVLDALGGNVNSTIRQFWLDRVGATSVLTDVADVGASRPLSQTYQHAKEMLEYWDKMAGTAGRRSRVVNIKKRYPDPVGRPLSRDGGVYVRTD